MNKQTRALQMAINALTNCSGFEEAIQACKEALAEQPIHQRWNIDVDGNDLLVCEGGHDKNEACNFVRYSPPKVETQEPVAFRNTTTGEFCTGGFELKALNQWTPVYTTPPKAETQEAVAYQPTSKEQSVMHSAMIRSSKLVHKATPPSREWQSLSDEEILRLEGLDCVDEEYIKRFARAVEAKLREKNT